MDIKKIRNLVAEGQYAFSKHAEREREIDMIPTEQLEDAMRNCEIIEDYPNDPRGASCLVLGWSGQRPIHLVCTIKTNPEELFLVTVYDPSGRPNKWDERYRRRR